MSVVSIVKLIKKQNLRGLASQKAVGCIERRTTTVESEVKRLSLLEAKIVRFLMLKNSTTISNICFGREIGTGPLFLTTLLF